MNDYHQQNPTSKKKAQLQISRGTLKRILYLGELPPNIDQYFLYQIIESKGKFTVESITTKTTKNNTSFAYVKFSDEKEAAKAKELLHLANIDNHVIRACIFNEYIENKDENKDRVKGNLFVRNLPDDVNAQELCEIFKKYGVINSVKLKQGSQGESLGYGYIQFATDEQAEQAIDKLNNTEIRGKRIFISKFEEKNLRDAETSELKSTLVFIQQVPTCINNEIELKSYLEKEKYGKILFVSFLRNNNNNCGAVIFEDKKSSEKCFKDLNNRAIIDGDIPFRITLNPSKEEIDILVKSKNDKFKEKFRNCNLIVKNLPKEMTERELYNIFLKYGDISSAKIPTVGKWKNTVDAKGEVVDKEYIYESKGFGYVCFKKPESAEIAITGLHGKNLENQYKEHKITVEYYSYDREERGKNENPEVKVKKNKPNKKKYDSNKHYHNQNHQQNQNHHHNHNQNQNQQQQNQNQNYQQNYVNSRMMPAIQYPANMMFPQQQPTKVENPFVNEIVKLLQAKDENRIENLGEAIFFYLNEFLERIPINNTEYDNEKLCSKFTGIFINTDAENLIEIFRYEENLIRTLKEIIQELQKFPIKD